MVDKIKKNPAIDLALDTIRMKKQALVFANSKRGAEKAAEDIAKAVKHTMPEYEKLASGLLHAMSRHTRQCERLAFCARKGVVFHHAGLVQKQRELIEESFRKGVIKVICCTPTLCISKDTKIWHGTSETEVSKFKNSNPLFALSQNRLFMMKAQKVQKIQNSSKLIQISSVSSYSIKVTPNHKMLIKRKNRKLIMHAKDIKKTDKIATIGKLDISKTRIPSIKEFIINNKTDVKNYKFGPKLSYFIGAMLGDGYSGVEINDNKIRYKSSPSIVGMDEEIFLQAAEICNTLGLTCRKTKNSYGTPQLILGKNKWFREYLVRCGVEKKDRKHIPEKLMKMDLENTASLIKGLFDTGGYVEKKVGIGFSNISLNLIKQLQKMLLRFGIVSTIRTKKAGFMKIYNKEYKTVPCFELNIHQKRSVLDFYRFIGFNLKRKQDDLIDLVAKISYNLNYVSCRNCRYKIYKDIFSGRSKAQKEWGKVKLKVINLLGENRELGSRELKKLLYHEPKKKDRRLNHHYELIKKRRIGNRSNTEWIWSLNPIGKWIFNNILSKNKKIVEFFGLRKCPLCEKELDWRIKRGWRDSDFEGDIFWDNIREIKEVESEENVYDVVLSTKPKNDHMFVANGFIVHNSYGMNLPAFRAIIKDIRRFSGRGMDYIPVMEYHQICGRCGRPGKEEFGEAITVVGSPKEQDKVVQDYIFGDPEPILSKLAVEPVLRFSLLSLIATGFTPSIRDVFGFFAQTFWAYQFRDAERINQIILRMLEELHEFDFISIEGRKKKKAKKGPEQGFVSADELYEEEMGMDAGLGPTLLGKRIAELYIDPLTAHKYIVDMKKAAKRKKVTDLALMFMLCSALEMRPMLKIKNSEFDEMSVQLSSHEQELFERLPEIYEDEYYDALSRYKTALLLEAWVDERSEDFIMKQFNIRPGELHVKKNNADWLIYSADELCRILNLSSLKKELKRLRLRVKYGAKAELLTLLQLENIGRVRARKLYRAGLTDLGRLKKADIDTLSRILGRKIAISVKEQLGQKVQRKVKDYKEGQQLLV